MHAAMHAGAYVDQPLRPSDKRRQNVGGEHIDGKDARNSRLHLYPPLARADSRVVDHRIEAAELVDLIGHCCCPGDRREVSGNNSTGARRPREGIAASPLVSPVQYDLMALLDQKPGRYKPEAIRR